MAIIAVIVISIINNIEEANYNTCLANVQEIENAAEQWHNDHPDEISQTKDERITVKELQEAGYLDADEYQINPVTKESMAEEEVRITYDPYYDQYSYDMVGNTCEAN